MIQSLLLQKFLLLEKKRQCFGLTFTYQDQWLITKAAPCSIHLVLAQGWERLKPKTQQAEGVQLPAQSTAPCQVHRKQFMFINIKQATSIRSPIRVNACTAPMTRNHLYSPLFALKWISGKSPLSQEQLHFHFKLTPIDFSLEILHSHTW